MCIPYNKNLCLDVYKSNPNWHQNSEAPQEQNVAIDTVGKLFSHTFQQTTKRSVQLIRDMARLILKVPVRSVLNPIFFESNWQELERAKVNTKLTGYALLQVTYLPIKFILASITFTPLLKERAQHLLENVEEWTALFDGRAAQLEALKEEGAKKAENRQAFDHYRNWLYSIDPKLCRK